MKRRKTSPVADRLRRNPVSSRKSDLRGRKLWCFRLAALVFGPLFFLAVLEVALRLFGFGHAAPFLLPAENNGRNVWIQNDRFGWRFFGRNFSRSPQALSINRQKPPGSIRVFVFGESAAFGDPQPAFGLPRMIESMLSLRYPSTKFEVVNVAMTAINSHVVRAIAHDCAKADGDIWVIYMGNNEVVGPFGAGTPFGRQTPPLPLIRGSLAVKSTRTGQLLEAAQELLQPPPADKSEWGGMLMFLDKQVRADDPAMQRVYSHFERNLSDIIRTGRDAGARVVVSTVAVNLKDCAPFASMHKQGLNQVEQARWDESYAKGIQMQDAAKFREALAAFDEAARLDDQVAELQFRRGSCALGMGDIAQARRNLEFARDLDTLRFRCDSRMNQITRRIAAGHESQGILLADAEAAFNGQNPATIPGNYFFYEHVHLTWEGNWLLARTIAEQVAQLLPQSVTNHAGMSQPWPSAADCAKWLAWSDVNRCNAISDILGRMQDPPFTHQLDHDAQMTNLSALLRELSPATQSAGVAGARELCEAAAAARPEDASLQSQLVELRQQTGDLKGSVDAARRYVELMPHVPTGWYRLGMKLAQNHQEKESIEALETALHLEPENVWTLNSLASAHKLAGRTDEALREFRRAVAIKPRFGIAYLGIGQILEEQGRTQEAEEYYHKALQNRIHRSAELATLARFCAAKAWFTAAVTNFQDALELSPADASLHLDLAKSLAALGRNDEEKKHLTAAARLDPTRMEVLFRLGLQLGREGKAVEAAQQFRDVVRINPDLIEARLNLGVALMKQNLNSEALEQFDEVLRRSPTNILALQYVQALRGNADVPAEKRPAE